MVAVPRAARREFVRFAHDNAKTEIRENLLRLHNEALDDLPEPPEGKTRPPHVDNGEKVPLGERLGFTRITLNVEGVLAGAKAEMGETYTAPVAPHDVIQKHLLREIVRISEEFELDPALLNDRTLAGKNHLGWYLPQGGSGIFDLGKAHWRIPDWLPSPVQQALTCKVKDLTALTKDEALGDGIVAVVQGHVLGLAPDTIDFAQVRSTVRDESGKVVRLFKGIVMIHPQAQNVIAWPDGYGDKVLDPQDPALDLAFYVMTWGSQANFRSRYTEQGLYYQGVPGWARRFFGLSNIHQAVSDEHDRDVDRLMKADAPIKALGGFGFIALAARMMQRGAYAGHSRIALPAKAFGFINADWARRVYEIEHVTTEGDLRRMVIRWKELREGHDPEKIRAYGVPYYFVPHKLRNAYAPFKHDGRIRRVLNRRPDLSTGQCTRTHELLGSTPFNAIVVPSWSMELSGCDFDGDAIVDFPLPEQGGLYVPFNELPAEERTARLEGATANRKAVDKTPYGSTLERWAGQLEAARILGAADLGARRYLDMGDPRMARALQAWVQAAVDRQKRPVPWPHPKGPRLMPSPQKEEGHDFLTDVLRDILKSEDAEEGESDYRKALANTEARLGALHYGATLAARDPEQMDEFHCIDGETAALALRWCLETDWRLDAAFKQLSTRLYGNDVVPVPFEGRYPKRARGEGEVPAQAAAMVRTVRLLDGCWDAVLRDYTLKKSRRGAFHLKDGLLGALRDVSNAHGEASTREAVADQVTDYNLFRELATPRQLKAYFDVIDEGELRVSDITCLNNAELWERFKTEDDAALVSRNTQKVWVGFHQFKPHELELVKGHGGGVVIEAKGVPGLEGPIPTNCRSVSDALLELREHLVPHYGRTGALLKRKGLAKPKPVPKPVGSKPSTKPASGVAGIDAFRTNVRPEGATPAPKKAPSLKGMDAFRAGISPR